MKSGIFLVSLLAGAISISPLKAGEPPPHVPPDDSKNAAQLREEKLNQHLETIKGHCQKMLDMQKAVHNGIKDLAKAIEDTADKKPRPKDKQAAIQLAGNVQEIIAEATQTIEKVEAEGSAIAFSEVIQQVREDMMRVQRRLESGDVGTDTQALELDITATLGEMVEVFKSR